MPTQPTVRVVDPKALPESELGPALARLHELYETLYEGIDRRHLRALVLAPSTTRSRLHLIEQADGRLLGCTLLLFYEAELLGQAVDLIHLHHLRRRPLAGPDALALFLATELGRLRLTRPGRPLYCIAPTGDPATWSLLQRTLPGARSPWQPPVSPEDEELAHALADSTGLELVDPAQPLLRKRTWRLRLDEVERRYWRQSEDPAAAAFMASCPSPELGQVLVLTARIDLAQLASGLRAHAGRRWQEAAETLQALGLGTAIPAATARPLLQGSPLFETASEPALDALAHHAERRSFAPDRVLMRQGAPAEAMLVVVEGRAQVVLEPPSGEQPRVLAGVGPGDVLGEVGLLTGEARSATVIATEPTTTLWLSRPAVLQVLADHEELALDAWRLLAQRRLDSLLVDSARFRGQAEAARRWLVDGLRPTFFAAGSQRTLLCPGTLFLVAGELEVDGDQGWFSLRGPALMPCVGPARCQARTDAVVAVAPPLGGLGS